MKEQITEQTAPTLTTEQRTAVESDAKQILLESVAGSGKTRVLVERIVRLMESGVDPQKIVAITYSNSAAHVLEQRLKLKGYSGLGYHLGFVGTLHSYCVRLLKQYGPLCGYPSHFAILSQKQADEVLQEVATDMRYSGTKGELEEAVTVMIGNRKTMLTKAQIAAAAFYVKLTKNNLLTFDMVLYRGLVVIGAMPEDLGLYLLVDEYQDACAIDAAIYAAMPCEQRFMVGDVRQSIFGFRGSSGESMMALRSDPSFTKLSLTLNFRSDANIVAAADKLMNGVVKSPPMVSATGGKGWVRLAKCLTGDTEIVNAHEFIKSFGNGKTNVAVLLRTNALVKEWVDRLTGLGLNVSSRVVDLPEDWDKVLLLLSLLCDPDNDWLAYRALVEVRGKEVADDLKRKALKELKSINQVSLGIPQVCTVGVALKNLRNQAGDPALVILEGLVENAPGDFTVPDLLFAAQRVTFPERTSAGITVSTIHCSPADEPVLTVNGFKPLGQLDPKTDRLVSLDGRCNQLTRGRNDVGMRVNPLAGKGFKFTMASRNYVGDLIVLTTDESKTRVTPEHRVRVRFTEEFYGKWNVYLMRRGDWWRIGVCGTVGIMPYKSGGISGRLATERADEAWILGVCNSKKEALSREVILQSAYGITGLSFENTGRNGFTSEELHSLHSTMSLGVDLKVCRLLSDFKLLREHPLYTRQEGKKKSATESAFHGYWFVTAASNIIDGYMEIQVANAGDFKTNGKPRVKSVVVTRQPFCGVVYGLDVPPHRLYISGGAIVHNSAKGCEWDYVIVGACEDGVLPHKGGDIQEDQRLLYVAMTRARRGLVLSYAEKRKNRFTGQFEAATPSRFLKQIVI